jgi:hypothetical protein
LGVGGGPETPRHKKRIGNGGEAWDLSPKGRRRPVRGFRCTEVILIVSAEMVGARGRADPREARLSSAATVRRAPQFR